MSFAQLHGLEGMVSWELRDFLCIVLLKLDSAQKHQENAKHDLFFFLLLLTTPSLKFQVKGRVMSPSSTFVCICFHVSANCTSFYHTRNQSQCWENQKHAVPQKKELCSWTVIILSNLSSGWMKLTRSLRVRQSIKLIRTVQRQFKFSSWDVLF